MDINIYALIKWIIYNFKEMVSVAEDYNAIFRFKNIAGIPLDLFTDPDIFAITISYKTMDKIDPNYKG